MHNDIHQVLPNIPNFDGRELTVKRINGGITNINWCISDKTSGEKFFVKLHGEGTEQYINRKTALAAAEIAARRGVGPQVLFYCQDLGVEVHEFLDAYRSCNSVDVQDATIRSNIMSAYASVHQELTLEETNTGFQQLDKFVAATDLKRADLANDIPHLIWQCRRAQQAIEASGIDLRGCYNDAYVSNYMRNDHGEIKIIDWEYAANNDPYWDIGMFCIESFFDDLNSISSMLEMYDGRAADDRVARTYLYVGVALVRWGLWAFNQQGNDSISFDFEKYSRILLMRARKQVASDSWEWALSKV